MRRFLICLAAIVAMAAVGWVAFRSFLVSAPPTEVRLTKTDVGAPPEAIFALIEDFRNWGEWSPHEKADPAVRRTYSGAAKGKGAIYEWDGGGAIGAGRAEVVESAPPAKIVIALDLTRPVAGRLALTFTLAQISGKTQIDVATSGPSDLVAAVMNMLFVGGDSLFGLSCAVGASPKALCDALIKGLPRQP